MANAMLEDDFKVSHPESSHPDLAAFGDAKAIEETNNYKMLTGYDKNEKLRSFPTRKSVEFAIEPPPAKRSRQNVPWTAKQVVNGTF
jgi:hypothetical protein